MISRHLKEKILEAVAPFLPDSGGANVPAASLDDIEAPPDQELGDAAFPVFALSRALKKNPKAIAEDLARKVGAKLGRGPVFEKISAAGGYVNFTFAPEFLYSALFGALKKEGERFGSGNTCAGQKVMIEYSGPNTHKEFHIGHLRNVAIGDSLVRLYRASSCHVIGANYVNDMGLHVAVCLWAMKKFHSGYAPAELERQRWLGEVYAEGMRALENDAGAQVGAGVQDAGATEAKKNRREVDAILAAIESRSPEVTQTFLETRQWSLDGFNAIYNDLGVRFDAWFFESDIKDEGKEIVNELMERGIAKKSDGAVIVDLRDHGLDVFLILKADLSGLYATSDLALAHEKFKKYEIDTSIYVTDVRQSFYFKQLFKTLELAGFKKNLKHVGYEFVRLPDGAMSSRLGRVVLYQDLAADIFAHALKETQERHADWAPQQAQDVAHKIAVGAMKFDMLKHDPGKVIVFDVKEAVSFDGYTAPYIQYTYARIMSIMRRHAKESKDIQGFGGHVSCELLVDPAEKNLSFMLLAFPDVIERARAECNSAILCRFLYDTAHLFSSFYEKCPVLSSEEILRDARLALSSAVALVLKRGLGLLGVDTVEEM